MRSLGGLHLYLLAWLRHVTWVHSAQSSFHGSFIDSDSWIIVYDLGTIGRYQTHTDPFA